VYYCVVVDDDVKQAHECESSNDTCQTQTSVKLNSPGFDQDCCSVFKHVPLKCVQPISTASHGVPGIQPSMKKKRGHPLSVHRRQRLLVKGFTFSYICKKFRKMESGSVGGDINGYSKKAFVASDMVALPNSEPCGIERCAQPQTTSVDGSLLNDADVSVMRKCDGKMEHQCDSGDAVRTAKRCEKANDVSVDTNAAVAQRHRQPRKVRVAGGYSFKGDDVRAGVVRRRGRPQKRALVGVSNSMSDNVTCRLQQNRDANTVVVRRRGRPHKIFVDCASMTAENVSVATKFDEHEKRQYAGGSDVGKTGELEKSDEMVRSSTDANSVARKRGRPRKRPIDSTSVDDKKMSVEKKYCLQEHCGSGAAVVRKRGQPERS